MYKLSLIEKIVKTIFIIFGVFLTLAALGALIQTHWIEFVLNSIMSFVILGSEYDQWKRQKLLKQQIHAWQKKYGSESD